MIKLKSLDQKGMIFPNNINISYIENTRVCNLKLYLKLL